MFRRNLAQDETHTPNSDDSRSAKESRGLVTASNVNRSRWDITRRRKIIFASILGLILLLALALGLGLGLGLRAPEKSHKGPNVLVIMSDDQDMLLDSMSAMPNVKSIIGAEGVTYEKHYCTVAWCCPSRVNFLTGRAAHNTNVTSTVPPYGGWPKFTEEGLHKNYLPVWINDAGINTYYVGKLMNGYSKKLLANPSHPKGFTDSSFLLDPWTYAYYHSHWTNGYTDQVTPYIGTHTTDVTQEKALAMLDSAAGAGKQFFMMVAPVAPHQETWHGTRAPPVPEGFKGKFHGSQAPRTDNFNPDEPSGASWVYNLPKLDDGQIKICDDTQAHRLGNIAAIDAMVATLVQKLEHHGILDNTYIIYTTDNGFHIGNHRLLPGKRCPYEEDINIPLLIRGPDVPKGLNSTITNSHTDMAPTILQMLGLPTRDEFDGAPIAYSQQKLLTSTKNELVSVEFWTGAAHTPIGFKDGSYYNNTYKALRLMSDDYSLYYSTWCTGEREFYDMKLDYVQMNNRLGSNPKGNGAQYYGRSETELIARLDALLMVTKSCKQDSCRAPWGVMFPKGEVTNLEQAMQSNYDSFFANQPKVTFSACSGGYIIQDEGPQNVLAFTSSSGS